jgi:hypothetical protein
MGMVNLRFTGPTSVRSEAPYGFDSVRREHMVMSAPPAGDTCTSDQRCMRERRGRGFPVCYGMAGLCRAGMKVSVLDALPKQRFGAAQV